jgi:hypothetical protein
VRPQFPCRPVTFQVQSGNVAWSLGISGAMTIYSWKATTRLTRHVDFPIYMPQPTCGRNGTLKNFAPQNSMAIQDISMTSE